MDKNEADNAQDIGVTAPEEKGVRADVLAAVEQLQEAGGSEDTGAAPSIVDGQPAPMVDDAEKPPRAKNGQYKAQQKTAASAATTKAKTVANGDVKPNDQTELPPADDQPKPAEGQSNAVSEAPGSWAAEAKASWKSLPAAVQAAVLKREDEMNQGGQQWSEERRYYQDTLAPLVAEAHRINIDPREGLQRLLNANKMLNENAPYGIAALASMYGVDLGQLASQISQNPAAFQRPNGINSELESRFSTIENFILSQQHNQSLGLVNSFAESPDNPYFTELEEDINRVLPIIKMSNPGASPDRLLKMAYDQALWSNQTVRAKVLDAERNQRNAQTANAVRTKANQASKAAVSIHGQSTGVTGSNQPQALRTQSRNRRNDISADVAFAIQSLTAGG